MWFAKVWGIRGSYVEGESGRETKVLDRKLSFLIEFSPVLTAQIWAARPQEKRDSDSRNPTV